MSKKQEKKAKNRNKPTELNTKVVKAKDLRPGDAIVQPHPGMVVNVDIKGKDPFWNVPNMTFYDVHDNVYGPLTGPLDKKCKFTILVDRKDIVKMYEKIDYEILSHVQDTLDRRKRFKKVFRKALDSMILKKKESRKTKPPKGE